MRCAVKSFICGTFIEFLLIQYNKAEPCSD